MTEAVEVRDNAPQSRFEAIVDHQLARADYVLAPGAITFTHTVVPEALGGRGIGGALVRAGLESARRRGLKVIPQCPFFAAYFKTHPQVHDLLHPDCFEPLGLEP